MPRTGVEAKPDATEPERLKGALSFEREAFSYHGEKPAHERLTDKARQDWKHSEWMDLSDDGLLKDLSRRDHYGDHYEVDQLALHHDGHEVADNQSLGDRAPTRKAPSGRPGGAFPIRVALRRAADASLQKQLAL